jgi:hypothetical protein
MMSVIRLYREHPGTCKKEILGTLSESQLDFLMENVEEEFDEDEEYLLMQDTINFMKEQGAVIFWPCLRKRWREPRMAWRFFT